MNILVADATEHGSSLSSYLQTVGHEVVRVQTGQDALLQTRTMRPDAIIADRGVPGLDGYSLAQRLRLERYEWAYLLWADAPGTGDVIAGLSCGADDYVSRATDYAEIGARLEAVRRRLERGSYHGGVLTVGLLAIDRDRRLVTVRGQDVRLTPKEYQILLMLAVKPEAVQTRESLCRAIGYTTDVYGRSVDSHVNRMRAKFERAAAGTGDLIESVYGVGYRLVVKRDAAQEAA